MIQIALCYVSAYETIRVCINRWELLSKKMLARVVRCGKAVAHRISFALKCRIVCVNFE